MYRRALLKSAGATTITGVTGVSGCVQVVSNRFGSYGGDSEWRYDIGGRVAAAANGFVFGVQETAEDGGEGSVFALDAGTGRPKWTYKGSQGHLHWTDLTVADAVYFGSGTDVADSPSCELTAMEFDGERRWIHETRSVSTRPRFVDGAIYAGSGLGVVRAIDAKTGKILWRTDLGKFAPRLIAVDEAVYVSGDRSVYALDLDDGEALWRYDCDEGNVHAALREGTVYVDCDDEYTAVVDGESRWEMRFDSEVEHIQTDHALVTDRDRFHAVTVPSGNRRWSSQPIDEPWGRPFVYRGNTLYFGGHSLVAIDTTDWTERWRTPIGAKELIQSITVTEQSATVGGRPDEDHAIVSAGENRLATVTPGGEQTWTRTVEGNIRDVVVEDDLFVGTDEAVYALNPASTTPTD